MKFKLTQYVLLASLTSITGSTFATTRYTDEATFSAALGAAPFTLESFEPVSGGNAPLSNGSEATFLTGYHTGSGFDQLFVGVIDSIEFTSIAFHGTTPDDSIYFDRMQTALAAPEPVPEPKIYAMLLTGLGLLGVSVHRRKQKVSVQEAAQE